MTGQQFVSDWKITSTYEKVLQNKDMPDWKDAYHYKVTFKMRSDKLRQFTCYYSMGKGLKRPPSAAEVLECLAMDIRSVENENFEDWASSMGYDVDSRKAERIYLTIQEQAERMENFLHFANAYKTFTGIEESE